MGVATLTTELAQYLETRGVGNYEAASAAAVSLFVEWLPSAPNEAVALYTSGGVESDHRDGYDEPNVQALVRGTKDARTALAKAQAVYSALHGLRNVILAAGTELVGISALQSGPIRLGPDENGRHLYTLNFRCLIGNPTTHRQ